MGIKKNTRIVKKFLELMGWKGDYSKELSTFCGDWRMDGLIGVVHLFVHVHDEIVTCDLLLPLRVPPGREAAMAELVCRINCALTFGVFEFNVKERSLTCRYTMSSDELEANQMVKVHQLVHLPLSAVDRYGAALVKVILGARTPEEAMAETEKEYQAMLPEPPFPGELDCVPPGSEETETSPVETSQVETAEESPKSSGETPSTEKLAASATAIETKKGDDEEDGKGDDSTSLLDDEDIDGIMFPPLDDEDAPRPEPKFTVPVPVRDYSLEGLSIRGDIPLAKVVGAVRNFYRMQDEGSSALPDRPRMNLLLWGPPGTGKSEFVAYLGQQLGSKVSVKMASDILSRFVGTGERAIRRMFKDAEKAHAILFLDEIDGVMQDRSGAKANWEVTQVNELLDCMEKFSGVMIGATNFMDNLDAAVMRRFTYKLEFGYLDGAGKRLFFDRAFKTPLSAAEARRLDAIQNLTPGDFKTVSQKLFYIGDDVGNGERLAALEQEVALKRDTNHVCRGFAA
jgi:hypothetical protein